jgi:hypothetical protein
MSHASSSPCIEHRWYSCFFPLRLTSNLSSTNHCRIPSILRRCIPTHPTIPSSVYPWLPTSNGCTRFRFWELCLSRLMVVSRYSRSALVRTTRYFFSAIASPSGIGYDYQYYLISFTFSTLTAYYFVPRCPCLVYYTQRGSLMLFMKDTLRIYVIRCL